MKFYTIALFIFLVHISAAVINSMNITDAYSIQPTQSWFDAVGQSSSQNQQYFQSSAQQSSTASFGFGDFVKGFAIFVLTFAFGLVAVPYTMMQFGMDLGTATLFSLPVYLVYGGAIAQFISNRANKGMN